MNRCTFYGQICSKTFEQDQDATGYGQVFRITLQLKVENRRNTRSNNRKIDYEILNFEAWGGAALTIESNTECGDHILVIDSTARAVSHDFDGSPSSEEICFRINEFKIISYGGN